MANLPKKGDTMKHSQPLKIKNGDNSSDLNNDETCTWYKQTIFKISRGMA